MLIDTVAIELIVIGILFILVLAFLSRTRKTFFNFFQINKKKIMILLKNLISASLNLSPRRLLSDMKMKL
jgi:hypothetical protein